MPAFRTIPFQQDAENPFLRMGLAFSSRERSFPAWIRSPDISSLRQPKPGYLR
jgi:hypothetical protein